ncbi:MAG: acyl-CoA dehydrogenase family protein [Chloroflexota bacterium]
MQPILPPAPIRGQTGELPVEDIEALRESSFLTLSVPEAFGGLGRSLADYVVAEMELAQGSAHCVGGGHAATGIRPPARKPSPGAKMPMSSYAGKRPKVAV